MLLRVLIYPYKGLIILTGVNRLLHYQNVMNSMMK